MRSAKYQQTHTNIPAIMTGMKPNILFLVSAVLASCSASTPLVPPASERAVPDNGLVAPPSRNGANGSAIAAIVPPAPIDSAVRVEARSAGGPSSCATTPWATRFRVPNDLFETLPGQATTPTASNDGPKSLKEIGALSCGLLRVGEIARYERFGCGTYLEDVLQLESAARCVEAASEHGEGVGPYFRFAGQASNAAAYEYAQMFSQMLSQTPHAQFRGWEQGDRENGTFHEEVGTHDGTLRCRTVIQKNAAAQGANLAECEVHAEAL